jgi:pimeloyl-ACP methyl ester carboxylesterase
VHSERIAQRIRGAQLVVVEGAAHLSALEHPQAVNDALVPFVSRALSP